MSGTVIVGFAIRFRMRKHMAIEQAQRSRMAI